MSCPSPQFAISSVALSIAVIIDDDLDDRDPSMADVDLTLKNDPPLLNLEFSQNVFISPFP